MPMSERTARAAARILASGCGVAMALPSITMRPSLGVSNRAMQRSSVVLPDPEGPTMQTTSRSITGSDTRVSTWCSPNFFDTASATMIGAPVICQPLPPARFADARKGSNSHATSLRMTKLDERLAGRIAGDKHLWRDFNDICDTGGRLAGTESEKRAFALLRERVRALSPANTGRSIPVPYGGWRARRATLRLETGAMAPCHPLVRTIATPAGGLTAEVIDLGRGTPDEFAEHAGEIKGRIVPVRHELMFAAGTIHRRRKYDMARAGGAVGFLIAG